MHVCNHEAYRPIDVSGTVHPSWIAFFGKNGFALNELLRWSYVTAHERGYDVRPNPEDVMNVFRMSPEAIRVVMVGQDPYPQEGVANGHAFATNGKSITASLERLFACIPGIQQVDGDYTLRGWIQQGVFLLNKTPVLWVNQKAKPAEGQPYDPDRKPLARLTEGPDNTELANKWHNVIRNVCIFIASARRSPRTDFILVGEKAAVLNSDARGAIVTGHPSSRNTKNPFDGSCFEKLPYIDWAKP